MREQRFGTPAEGKVVQRRKQGLEPCTHSAQGGRQPPEPETGWEQKLPQGLRRTGPPTTPFESDETHFRLLTFGTIRQCICVVLATFVAATETAHMNNKEVIGLERQSQQTQ